MRYKTTLQLILIGLLIMCFSRCNVLKSKRSTVASTDSVSKRSTSVVDTGTGGSVSRGTSKETFDWSKLTIQYPRDTPNMTNIYNYPQRPATVVYETGKGTKEEARTDSNWFKNFLVQLDDKYDARFTRIEESVKNKETKPSIWFYIILIAGSLFGWEIIKYGWKFVRTKYLSFIPKIKS